MASKQTWVALLRGINVGGKHCVPMKELAALFAKAGCRSVRTYIQSGNVVFTAPGHAAELRASLEQGIGKRFGFAVPVVLRTTRQMAGAIEGNPFAKLGLPQERLHVYFLAEQPQPDAIKQLDPQRSPGDEFRVLGSEIYLHVPNGMGRTKLTSTYFDSKLGTICTARNWNTVQKLLEMMQAG